jgi:sodium pump decarboxylase gamma subunit
MATAQGIYITVLGMAILFVALLILMLAAMGLERLFRPKELREVLVRPAEEVSSEREKELVAAIAAAIALKLKRKTSNVKRKTSEEVLSSWKFLGRHRQLTGSREVKRRRQ